MKNRLYIIFLLLLIGYTVQLDAQHVPYSNVPDDVLDNPGEYSDELVFKAYQNKALKLLISDPLAARKVFKERIVWAKSKNLREYEGDTYSHLSELYLLANETDSALYFLKKAVLQIKDDQGFLAMSYLRLSECYLKKNQIDSVQKYLDLGSNIIFDNERVDLYTLLYTHLGNLANKKERFISSIEYYTEALEYADEAHITMRRSNVHSNISDIYSNIGDIESAKRHTLSAIQIAEEDGYYTTLLDQKLKLALHENTLHQYEEAKEIFEEILPRFESKKDVEAVISIHINMAYSYLKLGQKDKCKKLLDKATEMVLKLNKKNDGFAYQSVQGFYYLEKNNFEKAKQHLLAANEKAKSLKSTRKEIIALNGLRELSVQLNDPIQELGYTKAYYQKKDSLFSLKQSKIIYDHEARYQKAEQDLVISELNSENKLQTLMLAQRKSQLIGSVIGISILGLLSFFMFRLYRKVKEQNRFISKANEEKSILLKEIHHRVKNNLQVVSSLLGLQSRYVEDDTALAAINTGRARVQSMSLLHQNVYKNENLKSVDIQKYFEDLGHNLFTNYRLDQKNIEFKTEIENLEMDIDVVVPMGLITNELISNALKYAFEGMESGEIHLSIKNISGQVELKVKDNGVGIPFTELPQRSSSLGMQLVKSFAHKLKAKVKISNTNGTEISLAFDPRAVLVAAA